MARPILSLTFLALVLCPLVAADRAGSSPAPDSVRITASRDGGTLRSDGVFYDYADAERRIALKLWVPPIAGPIRGIMIHGNPGFQDGDSRGECFSPVYRMFAARHGFAIMGATWLYCGEVFARTGRQVLDVLDQWAEFGVHPELRHAPFVALGNSNGGSTAYNLTLVAPERALAFSANVPSPRWQNPEKTPAAAWRVPGLILAGPRDVPQAVLLAYRAWLLARMNGALWAWNAERDKGHAMGTSMAATMSFLDAAIRMRLPRDAGDPGGRLRALTFADGWMVHAYAGEWTTAHIFPGAAEKPGRRESPSDFGWVPNEDVARVLQSVSSYDRPYRITIEGTPEADAGIQSGAHLRSAEGQVVEPGKPLHVRIDGPALKPGDTLVLRDGARTLHTFQAGEALTFAFDPPADRVVLALTAERPRPTGGSAFALPTWCVVADPKIAAALAEQDAASATLRPAAFEPPTELPAGDAPGVLVAKPAPADAAHRSPSELWEEAGTSVRLDVHEGTSAPPDPLPPVEARALWSAQGLLLLWRIPAPAKGLELDFHLVRQSARGIWEQPPKHFVAVHRTLTLSGVQYQFTPEAGENSPVQRGFARGFHWRSEPLDAVQAKALGFATRIEDQPGGGKVVQMLVPWTQVGSPAQVAAPPPGTRFAAVLGFNHEKRKIRWPFGRNPWAVPVADGPEKAPWGEIVLAP